VDAKGVEPAAAAAAATSTPPAASTAPAESKPTGPIEPYRFTLTPSSLTASTREEVQLAWKIDGGPPEASGITPRVRVRIDWTAEGLAPPKPGTKPEPKAAPQTFPPGDDVCAAPPLARSVTLTMAARQSARIEAEVVGCRGAARVEETRARGAASVDWVPPYIAEVDVPAVLTAGSTGKGTIKFRGIGGPGAPPAVKVTASHPGIKITRQPEVAATSTFEFTIKPNVAGEARLTAEHVDTNGSGRIVGVLRKTAVVRVDAPR
jgi:hypothetical protein